MNRANILDSTLCSLFSNPEFDERKIEVIVSDNCSTDNTTDVVAKYPLVRYYRNSENIIDRNFSKVLEYATGSYIRLFNDTLSFKKNALKMMLDRIEDNSNASCNLFFYNNSFINNDCVAFLNREKDFLNQVSFSVTWIGNFGCWNHDFKKLTNKDEFSKFQFVQVDWSFKLVKNKNMTRIYFDDLFNVVVPINKGGYDLFDTFVNKYLYILRNEKIDFLTLETEKFRLCRYFIYPNLLKLLIYEREYYDFEINNPFKVIFKKYWYEPYFYLMLLVFLLKMLKYTGIKK
jgi:glycosyltransferase involved in cell wall biosynthesis